MCIITNVIRMVWKDKKMARKEIISRNDIIDAAFSMTSEQGVMEVTARKLAAYAGCSTQPIFRNFSGMEECLGCVFDKSLEYFDDYNNSYEKTSKVPFVNLGMAYISFATKEPHLFSFLFMSPNNKGLNMYSLLNARTGCVMNEMNLAREDGVKSPEMIFMKMWMLIHGAACMCITGDYDLTEDETKVQLEEAYKCFLKA